MKPDPCEYGHAIPDTDRRYVTCTECGCLLDQYADLEEDGP